MSWQHAGTRFKASAYNSGDSSYQSTVTLPVWSLEIMPLSYRPEGSSQQELYDGRTRLLVPTYGYRMSISYDYERTEYRPTNFDTMADLLALYHNYDFVDYFVRYENGSYTNDDDNPGAFSDYKVPKMIPEIAEDVGGVMFDAQTRTKERNLELRSQYVDKTYSTVRWTLD